MPSPDQSQTAFQIRRFDESGICIFAVVGELVIETAPLLEAEIAAVSAESDHIVVDLSGVLFMDSTGLRVLMSLRQHALGTGGRLVFVAPMDTQPATLLGLVAVTPRLEIARSREEALS